MKAVRQAGLEQSGGPHLTSCCPAPCPLCSVFPALSHPRRLPPPVLQEVRCLLRHIAVQSKAATAPAVASFEGLYRAHYAERGLDMLRDCAQCVFYALYHRPSDMWHDSIARFRDAFAEVWPATEALLTSGPAAAGASGLRALYGAACERQQCRPNVEVSVCFRLTG